MPTEEVSAEPPRELIAGRAWAALCTAWLLALCSVRAVVPVGGGVDFWAHAAIGRWILESRAFPQETLWIWGAEPVRWVAHSWGTQVAFAGLMRAGEDWGPRLAIGLCVLCGAASFGLLWRENLRSLARHGLRPDLLLVSMLALAVMCAGVRFKPRPELFTALFVTAQLLFWLAWHREDKDGNRESPTGLPMASCLALAAMWVLWANMHGAWAFGLGLWALTLLGDGLQDRFDTRWRLLLLIGICCVMATLVNPYGPEVWDSLRATRSQTFASIEEWKRPWVKAALPPEWIWGEFLLAAGALAAWACDSRRRWSHALWALFALAMFCQARRFLWLSALVHMAVLAHSGWALQRPWWLSLRRHASFRAALDLGTAALMALVLAFQTPRDILRVRAVPRTAPVELTRRAKLIEHEMALRGQIMRPANDYEYSSYYHWAFAGRPPLFIDLLNAYPDHLMQDYFELMAQSKKGQALLQKANVALLRPPAKGDIVDKFEGFLAARPREWRRVYKGRDGSIWRRR